MARGFCYLVAVIDWFTRKVLAWRLSITMDAAFCIEALEEALARHGKPDIFNSDQGSQFTSQDFTKVLLDREIKISMDGKGHGATMFSSSVCGDRSNTRRSICAPTTLYRMPERRSLDIWLSLISNAHIRALTDAHRRGLLRRAGIGGGCIAAPRFCRSCGRATPSLRRDKIARPRIRQPRQEST